MRRSVRLAKKAESEDEAPAVELKTPIRSTTKKVRPKKESSTKKSTVKSKGRPKKIVDESKEDKDIAESSDDVERKLASKELFPVQEVDQEEMPVNLNVAVETMDQDGQDVTKEMMNEDGDLKAEGKKSSSIATPKSSVKKDKPKNKKNALSLSTRTNSRPSKIKPSDELREVSELLDDEEIEIMPSKDPYPVTKTEINESQTPNKDISSPAKSESSQEKTKEIKSDDDFTKESQESSSNIAEKQTLGALDETDIPNDTNESSFKVISRVECSDGLGELNASKALSDVNGESSNENSSSLMESSDKEPRVDVSASESHRKKNDIFIPVGKSSRSGSKVDNRKPAKKFNFSSTDSKNGKNNLLKLTSDIFKNMSFSLTKEDILGEKSDSTKKLKSSETDVHKLDVISLKADNDKDVKDEGHGGLSSELNPRCDTKDLYFDIHKHGPVELKSDKPKRKELSIMKKSVLGPGLEKMETAPKVNESFREKKKKKKKEEGETSGPGWFNMPKTEMTEELKKDLQIIKMRNLLDTKRFYKSSDRKMPKYFQVGKVIEGATEFYSSRISKKERKRTMVDELLEDAEFRRKNKRKYLEIQSKKESGGKKYYKKMKNKRKETWARS